MKILVINPNTSASITDKVVAQVARHAGANATVAGVTASFGAPVIASRAAYAVGAHAALEAYAQHRAEADVVILACFGDPGVAALREVSGKPVIGLMQATLEAAMKLGKPYGIVTAGAAWGPMLREVVVLQEAAELFTGTEILNTDGLAISRMPEAFRAKVQKGIDTIAAKGASTVILGGAAFAEMAAGLNCKGTLLDCIDCATQAALATAAKP